jgi:hypothetical protein
MASVAPLLPSADELAELQDYAAILGWAQLDLAVWKEVAGKCGDSELVSLTIIAALPAEDISRALRELETSAVNRAKVNLAYNAVRKKLGLDESVINGGAPVRADPGTGAPPGDGTEEVESPNMPGGVAKNTLKVSHFFDQGCRLEVKPIEPEEIMKMRARWQSQMWLPPQKHLNPTDNQLSVLKRLSDLGHNMLAFDMGVWGPYGSRRERHFLLTAHHLNVRGEYQAKEVPGAQSLEDWLEGWAFATTTFVMGGIVERGVADAYAAHFKEMAENYPAAWWICCLAEWEFRFEFATEELARQKEFHAANPGLSRFDPSKPWNTVLMAGIKGIEAMQYWEASLKEKARRWSTSARSVSHPSWVHRQAELYNPSRAAGQSPAAGARQGENAPKWSQPGEGKRSKKRKAAGYASSGGQHSFPPKPPRVDSSAERRPDGRYVKAENNVEICYRWNRAADGCSTECAAQPPRMHVCEWCRGSHRAVACPSHPNWKPPKGKGDGKGKHL